MKVNKLIKSTTLWDEAVSCYLSGNYSHAETLIRQAIALLPDKPELYNVLGIVLARRSQFYDQKEQSEIPLPEINMLTLHEAADSFSKALQLNPKFAEACNNLGNVMVTMGKHIEGLDLFKKALALRTQYTEAMENQGNVLLEMRQYDQAQEVFNKIIAQNPDCAKAYFDKGRIAFATGKTEEAITLHRRALEKDPQLSEAFISLGNVYRSLKWVTEAERCYQKALEICPNSPAGWNNLGIVLHDKGQINEALSAFSRALALKPRYSDAHSNQLYSSLFSAELSSQEIVVLHNAWEKQQAACLGERRSDHILRNHRRLRIGYVSPDFHTHSVSYFIEPILAHHNLEIFEVYAYSDTISPDKTTERLKTHVCVWRDICRLDDSSVEELIRRDEIDILVDLAGHTARNRMLVFARKPAPIQISWIGYPGTTGLSAIDYRFTDVKADPLETVNEDAPERLQYLPDTFLCYRPPEDSPQIQMLPAIQNSYITYGSFNNYTKIIPEMIALWSMILKSAPQSRMILKAAHFADASISCKVLNVFEKFGVSNQRVSLLAWLPATMKHLEIYNQVDVALDTFPYNGTTTTCEALWMGVPVITMVGDRHASRVGASLMETVGLPSFIVKTPDDYVRKAVEIGQDIRLLKEIRCNLRQQITQSPLRDEKRMTGNVEDCYRQIWREWVEKREERNEHEFNRQQEAN